jgi:hypothetical protein
VAVRVAVYAAIVEISTYNSPAPDAQGLQFPYIWLLTIELARLHHYQEVSAKSVQTGALTMLTAGMFPLLPAASTSGIENLATTTLSPFHPSVNHQRDTGGP